MPPPPPDGAAAASTTAQPFGFIPLGTSVQKKGEGEWPRTDWLARMLCRRGSISQASLLTIGKSDCGYWEPLTGTEFVVRQCDYALNREKVSRQAVVHACIHDMQQLRAHAFARRPILLPRSTICGTSTGLCVPANKVRHRGTELGVCTRSNGGRN